MVTCIVCVATASRPRSRHRRRHPTKPIFRPASTSIAERDLRRRQPSAHDTPGATLLNNRQDRAEGPEAMSRSPRGASAAASSWEERQERLFCTALHINPAQSYGNHLFALDTSWHQE
ncbi:hypothetical protein HPB50_021432 [Hyalomma asiaticum]|uniref:Uncharacterized protein n=1 Tax=Hyalomma asiaticum TaxID=266040 RepID=A0ACB7TJQ2_HYAAI|nr:hypothetical protein HPB50_021432 [Hyalomma asiaticum]